MLVIEGSGVHFFLKAVNVSGGCLRLFIYYTPQIVQKVSTDFQLAPKFILKTARKTFHSFKKLNLIKGSQPFHMKFSYFR